MLGLAAGLAPGTQPGHSRIDLLEGMYTPVPQHLEERYQHIAHRSRVVIGPVVVEGRQVQVLRHDVQLVLAQLRQQVLGQNQRVDGGAVEGAAHAAAPLGDEAHVELRIVGGQRAVSHEVQKGVYSLRLGGRSPQHLVGDAGKLGDLAGQRPFGIGKRGELLHHLPVPQYHRSDLGDYIPPLVQTGSLNVETDDITRKVLFLVPVYHHPVVHVIDEVRLHAVKHLDLLGRVPCVGECLGHAVVGDGDGPMAPRLRPLDHVLVRPRLGAHLGEGIHGGHGGVQVELHPLLRRVVGLHGLGALHDGVGLQHHVAGEAVDVQLALDHQMLALLHPVHNALPLVTGEKLGHPHRAGIVRHIEAHHPCAPLFQLPVIHGKYVSFDDDGSHVQLQGAHGDALPLDFVLAVEQLSSRAAGGRLFLPRAGSFETSQSSPADLLRAAEGRHGILLHRGGRGRRRRGAGRRSRFSRHRSRCGSSRGRRSHLQLHPLHPVGQGQALLDLVPQALLGHSRALHLGADRAGRLIDHRPRDQIAACQGRQLFTGPPGGKQIQKGNLLCL